MSSFLRFRILKHVFVAFGLAQEEFDAFQKLPKTREVMAVSLTRMLIAGTEVSLTERHKMHLQRKDVYGPCLRKLMKSIKRKFWKPSDLRQKF